MLRIDGALGEGGGQMLRSSLSLSAVTGTPFEMVNIRAKRNKSGLLRQHLTCLQAAASVCNAELTGDSLGSGRILFRPRGIFPGDYFFSIGSAGSAVLVLQTVLPILLAADQPSTLVVEGGTHNEKAPPFDYFAKVFLPLLSRLDINCHAELLSYGFFPIGGGKIRLQIEPSRSKAGLALEQRGRVQALRATALVSRIPGHIADRELAICAERLRLRPDALVHQRVKHAPAAGNVLMIDVDSEHVTESFVGFGRRGRPAEEVAHRAIDQVEAHLDRDVPVGEYLADQLMLPMLLHGGGVYRTGPLSLHASTNAAIIGQFTGKPPHVATKRGITTVTVQP